MKITLALVLSFLILSSVILIPNSIAFAEKDNDSKQPNEKAKGLIPDQYIIVFKYYDTIRRRTLTREAPMDKKEFGFISRRYPMNAKINELKKNGVGFLDERSVYIGPDVERSIKTKNHSEPNDIAAA